MCIRDESPLVADRVLGEVVATLIFWSLVVLSIVINGYIGFGAIVFYICVQCLSQNSKQEEMLGKALNSEMDPTKIVEVMKNSPATFSIIVQNYHYVTHRDSKGRTRRRRVNTHRGEMTFNYLQWVDTSSPMEFFSLIKELGVVRIKLNLAPVFSQ